MPINGIETAYKDRYTFAPLSQRAVPIQWYTLPLRFIVAFILADLIVPPILSIYRAALRISDGANSRREQPRLDDYPNL